MSELSKQALKVDNNQSFPNNNTGYITPSRLRDFHVNMIDSLVDEETFNAFSQSVTASIEVLTAATASYATSAITASSLVTASFDNGTRNLTFTKGDSTTFNVNIPDVSGSAGDFVTTASFNAYTQSNDSRVASLEATSASLLVETQNLELFSASALISISNLNASSASQEVSINSLNTFTSSANQRLGAIESVSGSWITESETGSFATTGSNTFVGNQILTADLEVSGNTNLGFVTIADVGGINFNATGSYSSWGIVSNPSNGDFIVNSNPGNAKAISLTNGSGKLNIFNSAYIVNADTQDGTSAGGVNLNTLSGSLFLTPSGFSAGTASLLHVSSSAISNNVNLLFKPNNVSASVIVSGSSNLLTNPTANTDGFVRYVTSGNVAMAGAGVGIPEISASMAFSPTISNNYFGVSAIPLTLRGPASSSAYTINNNVLGGGRINIGSSAANNFEKGVSGVSVQNNIINGTVNASATKTALSSSYSLTSNVIAGTVNLNLDSSSVNLNTSNINGTLTLNNSYFPSSVTAASGLVGVLNSTIGGGLTIYTSGSNTTLTGAPRVINNTLNTGTANVISASFNGDRSNVNSATLAGHSLLVYGNNTRAAGATAADWGSTFVGRWNDINGNKAYTADTIFAVGTGTATAARKTGFLIDSGSNTFVEGTLNVSGSTSMTGSLTIQSGSGDLFMYGHKMFNVGAFQSSTTQSGSANVSQSMAFPTTDVSYGVTVASNTRLTVANAGVYNIQFSAQFLADTGADDVWIWLKKNGTNVPSTTGRIVLANNEELIASWNYVVEAAANDYFEIAWLSSAGDAVILAESAGIDYPAVPSTIVTVTQVR